MNEKYIRFDWAMKRMLRDRSTFGRSYPEGLEKANFDVLEGLLTVLFEEQVKIEELLRGVTFLLSVLARENRMAMQNLRESLLTLFTCLPKKC